MNNQYKDKLFLPGHTACAGCGQSLAIQQVAKALGKGVVIVNATGCSEVYSSQYGQSAWGQNWVHTLFENSSSVASGILAALRQRGDYKTKVVAQGGDGATFDIGLGLISGMWERGEDILYICYDNEAYMNTGVQSSGATPIDANTTTTPTGKKSQGSQRQQKDMIGIALCHGLKYIATATSAYPTDIYNKVKKALTFSGPTYLQILTPCVPGWGINSDMAVDVSKLAVQTGIYPIVEYVDGVLINKMKVGTPKPIEEYLKIQKRFSHILNSPTELARLKKVVAENIKKYGLA